MERDRSGRGLGTVALVELELQDVSKEVAVYETFAGDVVLRARVEVGLAARDGGTTPW
jgi:hypothetical protein